MKITVSVNGRFHAFDLASQLHKRGHLHFLITTYPWFKVKEWGLPRNKVVSLLPLEILNRLIDYFPVRIRKWLHFKQQELFDYWASLWIQKETELFVGWSSNSLHSLRKAKKIGAVTILDHGSSHVLNRLELLREEFKRQGRVFNEYDPAIRKKTLREFHEADYISIPSHFVKSTFLEHGIPEEKLIHIPYGVNLDDFRPIPKEDNTFRVIHCGAIILRKGVHYLLQALYEMNLPDADLWLIGSMSDEIKPFLKKYDNGRVYHKGPYPQNELYKYYSQGSVFCIASIEEGLALVQPQAMACGLPLICTTNTGGQDLIEDGKEGFVIPIRDVKALKEKISYLYDNQEMCRAMGQAARERVASDFTWDDYGEKIVREYTNKLGLV